MHRHILISIDASALSQAALEYGIALAKSVGAKVTVLTVSTPFHIFAVEPVMVTDTPVQYAKPVAALAKKYLDAATEVALVAGVNCETVHVEHDNPYLAIIETAAKTVASRCSSSAHRAGHSYLSNPKTSNYRDKIDVRDSALI
jgi:nucleotide-binding universal stress UspA family protein